MLKRNMVKAKVLPSRNPRPLTREKVRIKEEKALIKEL